MHLSVIRGSYCWKHFYCSIFCRTLPSFTPISNDKSKSDLLRKGLPKRKPIVGVENILLIASGKGGVGKSTLAVNLAVALKKLEANNEVGLLDADVFGPSIPLMMNLHEAPCLDKNDMMIPLSNYGIKCMSMGNLINKNSAVIWRGLMVMSALDKLIRQVSWAPLNFLIVDTPPGTGDTHLSLVQNLPIAGVLIVSTGQKAALDVTKRGITMFEKLEIPIIGIVNNMSTVRCSHCSHLTNVFDTDAWEFVKEKNIKILGNIPMEPSIIECCDNGKPVVLSHPDSAQAREILKIAAYVANYLKSDQDKRCL